MSVYTKTSPAPLLDDVPPLQQQGPGTLRDSWCQEEQQAREYNQPVVQVRHTDQAFEALDALEAQAKLAGNDPTRFSYAIPERRPYPGVFGVVRRNIFVSFVAVVFLGTGAWFFLDAVWVVLQIWAPMVSDRDKTWRWLIEQGKLFSVPLVCLVFTWFHVWLALLMMFYPLNFYGLPCRPIVPEWLGLPINGWQGIVPRKAHIMAERVCDTMIGNIVTIEEFMDRVEPDHFWDSLQESFGTVSSAVLERLMKSRCPGVWENLPSEVQLELKEKVQEETKKSFTPALDDIKKNINTILDLRQMSSDALASDPGLMVWMFRKIAARELRFITHVAAVMGFLLGLVQVVLYMALQGVQSPSWLPSWDYIMLPVSGLLIGYFTNWLAIKMTFSPVWPHMYLNNVINIQGVFMKRQKEASEQLAQLVCEKVVDARAMLNYMVQSPNGSQGIDMILEIYKRHVSNTVDKSLGRFGNIAPSFVKDMVDGVKDELIEITQEVLPEHTEKITQYMDETMKIRETLTWRLQRITPPEFERIIHPIFEEDEWILLVVGGFLGVVIGLLQAWALQAL